MDRSIFERLRPGDLVRHKNSGDAMRVVEVVGDKVVLVRHQTACNPREWDLVDESGVRLTT